MKSLVTNLKRVLVSEDGPTTVEYAVMLALIIIMALLAVQLIGTNVRDSFQGLADGMPPAVPGN